MHGGGSIYASMDKSPKEKNTKDIDELNQALSQYGMPHVVSDPDISPDDIAPEATEFHNYLKGKYEKSPEKLTKLRNAHIRNFYKFIAKKNPNLIFEKDNGKQFFLYDAEVGVYEPLSDVYITELVTKMYIDEGLGKEGKIGEVHQALLRFRAMFRERGVQLDAFDNNDTMFHCGNGWLNVENGEFEPHTPKRLSMRVAKVNYKADAVCENYDKMLNSYGLKEDQLRVIKQFSGLLLTGDISQQKMLVLLGRPGCGKSTIVEIWRHILGQLATKIDLDSLSNPNTRRFMGEDLIGRTLVHFDEANIKSAEMGTDLSNMITGDSIKVERKRVNGYSDVSNKTKVILSANRLPSGQDGIFRRMILIKFVNSFSENGTADRDLPAKLRTDEEMSGILNRMVEGLKDLRKMGGFTLIDGHEDMIEEFKIESDVISEFLETYFDPVYDFTDGEAESGIQTKVLYETYKRWAQRNDIGNKIFTTPIRFGKMLQNQPLNKFAHIHSLKKRDGKYWRGLLPKEDVSLCPDGSSYILVGSGDDF